METAQSPKSAAPGACTAFSRFVLCGGGVGVASSFAVAALASWIPWALANALITVVSTLLATELQARFTFGAGGRATGRQHAQSAGSAAAAYAVTCLAMLVLQQMVVAPGVVLEQIVYLSASALAGVARFAVLRLVVFPRNRSQTAAAARTPRLVRVTAPPRRTPGRSRGPLPRRLTVQPAMAVGAAARNTAGQGTGVPASSPSLTVAATCPIRSVR
jgi:putative flippase GtrA